MICENIERCRRISEIGNRQSLSIAQKTAYSTLLEDHIVRQYYKHMWINDDIWQTKLEGCRLEHKDGKNQCKKTTGLIGIVREHT